ncbi:hypothetical protein D7B24_007147 [Verticillium nonalfalfae]|uniref:Uncharacterized protein n=1 Tax=Verticillium nonalfalfae TaxID=1051616 RepID=A0A3M9Y976_9PEZI|nr:uncharacterized protein D7B24_007147 [Verticillium nonalfalfae]RNJ56542.1 hypothetical protein D7B24_007147 [Verticillium nonalfalfae]
MSARPADSRHTGPDRALRDGCEGRAAEEELTHIMAASIIGNTVLNIASNPVSPGSSSPPLDQTKGSDFVPPTRPSSTPFPHSEPRHANYHYLSGDEDMLDFEHDAGFTTTPYSEHFETVPEMKLSLLDLPSEVHEMILDHLFGYRVSTKSKSSVDMQSVTKSWNTALRHSRRRELSELALINHTWRILIQQRLFRHLKLKATIDSVHAAVTFFAAHDELRYYVKHIELWFPVFQPKYGPLALSSALALPTVTSDGLTNATYTLPANNCTLEEALLFVAETLPFVMILTLEGGERKKAPMVQHSSWAGPNDWALPILESVRTLVTRGQWNLMRTDEDFRSILSSLPNLTEWHGSYSKPKSKSYLSMARVLPDLPAAHLKSLHLCLESDYRREVTYPAHHVKVCRSVHFCTKLAEAVPQLEHFSYTGRICKSFFRVLAELTDPRTTRLKSIDITVKNCCRPVPVFHESGSGIQDTGFIDAFELLVAQGIRALQKLRSVDYLRIRFVDLDSLLPPLNPYFLLRGDSCLGIWSGRILSELKDARPRASYEELSETFGDIGINKDGRLVISGSGANYQRSQFRSLKVNNYHLLATSIIPG